jgi:hypothetical protein
MPEKNNKWSEKWATIPVKPKTKERLKALGNFDENWDDLLNKLADTYEEKRMENLLNSKEK